MSEITKDHIGKMIEVREYEECSWSRREYVGKDGDGRFLCRLPKRSEAIVPWDQARPIVEKKRTPMDPTTCPDFPWAIRHPDWKEGAYQAVILVHMSGIGTEKDSFSWEELMKYAWLDHATGKPLYVEVDA